MDVDSRTTGKVFDVTVRSGDEWVRLWSHKNAGWFSLTTSPVESHAVGTRVRIPTSLAFEVGAVLLELQRWNAEVDLREQP